MIKKTLSKFCAIIFYTLLIQSCTNSDNQNTRQEPKPVEIPEGKYVCTDQHSEEEHKGKFRKFLNNLAEEGKEEMYLNHTIFVRDKKIISSTITGEKQMPIETGESTTDNLFFIKMPVLNNEQTVEVRLLPSNRLRFSVMNQEMHYQLRD